MPLSGSLSDNYQPESQVPITLCSQSINTALRCQHARV